MSIFVISTEDAFAAMSYLGRQVILDSREKTIGYGLLYRDGADNRAVFEFQNVASKKLLDSLLLIGVEEARHGGSLFVNCPQSFLVNDYLNSLPPQSTTFEVGEDLDPNSDLLDTYRRLKQAGYSIALNQFSVTPRTPDLLPIVDTVIVDFRITPASECEAIAQQYSTKFRLLAKNVETRGQFTAARIMGYKLFQGHFFHEPSLLSTHDLSGSSLACVRLLQEAHKSQPNLIELEKIIKSDAALCYRLLHYLNSAAFYMQSAVHSIRHALALLGERELRKWASATAASLVNGDQSPEIVASALLRARFCELLSAKARCNSYDAFIMGLFSLLDAITGLAMSEVLNQVDLPPQVRAALLNRPGRLQEMKHLILAYEDANWLDCQRACDQLQLPPSQLAFDYAVSLQWANAIRQATAPSA